MTGLPSRTTSVSTATTEVVISEKSKLELLMLDLSGIAHSRISTIRIWCYPDDPVALHRRDAIAVSISCFGRSRSALGMLISQVRWSTFRTWTPVVRGKCDQLKRRTD